MAIDEADSVERMRVTRPEKRPAVVLYPQDPSYVKALLLIHQQCLYRQASMKFARRFDVELCVSDASIMLA
jgi:hypothetical protein